MSDDGFALEMNKKRHASVEDEQALPGLHDAVVEFIDDDDMKFLDLGCGNGHFSELLPDREFHHVDCVDRDVENFCNLDLSWDELPFEEDEFDVVLLVEVLEHLENPWHAVREAKRVGRKVVITTPVVDDLRNRLIFLRHGRFLFFFQPWDSPHVTPIFPWQLERMRGDWDSDVYVHDSPNDGGRCRVECWTS